MKRSMIRSLALLFMLAAAAVCSAEDNYFWRDSDGAYVRSALAYPGTLPPENAIRVAPPLADEGLWPQISADKSGWALAEDHRGKEGYVDGVRTMITQLGPLPAGWSDTPPAASLTLVEAKNDKKAAIDANTNRIRDRDGLSFSGARFAMNDGAMLKWTGLMAAKDMIPFPFTILTMDDQPFQLSSQADLMRFMAAALGYETAPDSPLSTGRILRQRVEAARTVEEVGAIVDDRE